MILKIHVLFDFILHTVHSLLFLCNILHSLHKLFLMELLLIGFLATSGLLLQC